MTTVQTWYFTNLWERFFLNYKIYPGRQRCSVPFGVCSQKIQNFIDFSDGLFYIEISGTYNEKRRRQTVVKYETENTAVLEEERSYFDGGYFAYIGCSILVGFVTAITLGIAYPWMCCWFQRWKAKHTVVCGKRMYFDGNGLQLIGKYLLWGFLSLITFGIYGLWMTISMRKWIAKHTHYVGEADNNSYFDGGVLGMLGTNLLAALVTVVPFVGPAWSKIIKLRWECRHTVVDSRRHIFAGSVGSLFVKYLLWGLLSIITLGIYGLFLPVKRMRWETENTIDNEHTTSELIARGEYRANVHTDAAAFKTYKVEDEMECVKAGVTDTTSQEELLALANNGVRSAQYAYVVRYAQGQYTQEPFSGFLKAAAQAQYAPAICLYLQTHETAPDTRADLLQKAADKGQSWAVKAYMTALAHEGLGMQENKNALPVLKRAVRYGDILIENQEPMTQEEENLIQKCMFAIRRIQSTRPKSTGRTVAGIIIGALIGIPALAGLLFGAGMLISGVVENIDSITSGMMGENDWTSEGFADEQNTVGQPGGVGGLRGFLRGIFGGSAGDFAMDSVVVQQPMAPDGFDENISIPEDDGHGTTGGVSDFWGRFTRRMEEDYCVITWVDEASDGTVKYEITCDHWYWKSLHYMEILQSEEGVQRMSLWGVRIYEPDSPDPTMNEMQWSSIVREIFKQLDLGDYEQITPYTANGSYTETYGNWQFTYDNNENEVRLTVTSN